MGSRGRFAMAHLREQVKSKHRNAQMVSRGDLEEWGVRWWLVPLEAEPLRPISWGQGWSVSTMLAAKPTLMHSLF